VVAASAPPLNPQSVSSRRVLTIPNVLSVVRLSCIPLFLWLLFGEGDRAAAAWLLGALGATDWVDGYVARRYNQVSELGKVLDPTADRLLLIVAVGAIIIDGSCPLWFGILVVVREVALGVTLVVLTLLGMRRFDVSWWGKAGTFGLMFAFPLFLMGSSDVGWHEVAWLLGYACGIPGLIFSYYAAFTYVPTIRRSFAEGRQARREHIR
jgi:cardiolipin synthase